MTHKDKDLEKIYNDVFADATEYINDYEIQAVAATYMAIAMRLYKTHLQDDAYKKMIETVMETEVKPYDPKKVLHEWDEQVIVLQVGLATLQKLSTAIGLPFRKKTFGLLFCVEPSWMPAKDLLNLI